MSSNSGLRFLQCALCLGLALTAMSCSEETRVRSACEEDIEDVHYASMWQDSTGACVPFAIMFELRCEPGNRLSIRLGLTTTGVLASYKQSDALDLWYERTNSTLVELPPDAIHTGLFNRGRELYIAADHESAYVRTQHDVEIWQGHNNLACSSPDP